MLTSRMIALAGASLISATLALSPGVAGADYYAGLKAFDAKQYAAAAQQWQQSANAGDARSAFRLGKLYQEGRGVARDYAQAYFWYKVAEAKGNNDAGIAAHFVSRKLTAAQRRQIEARARAYKGGAVANNGNGGNGGTDGGTDGGTASTGPGPFGPMAGKELRRTYQDGSFRRSEVWMFGPNGQLRGNVFMTEGGSLARTEEGSDTGRWTVEGGRLCVQWKSWNDGKKVCYTAQKSGKSYKLVGDNGRTTTAYIANQ